MFVRPGGSENLRVTAPLPYAVVIVMGLGSRVVPYASCMLCSMIASSEERPARLCFEYGREDGRFRTVTPQQRNIWRLNFGVYGLVVRAGQIRRCVNHM